jgi:SNF2 family DNA or RNA helicase
MSTTLKTEQLRTQLIETYQSLSSSDREIVQLLSVSYISIHQTKLLTCINTAGIRDASGRAFSQQTLNACIERLYRTKVILQSNVKSTACHRLLMEIATRDAVKQGRFQQFVNAIQEKAPLRTQWNNHNIFASNEELIREIRIGVYRQDLEYIQKQLESYRKYHLGNFNKTSLDQILWDVCLNPFNPGWFRTLSPSLYNLILSSLLLKAAAYLEPAHEAFAMLEEDCLQQLATQPQLSSEEASFLDQRLLLLTQQLLLKGEIDRAQSYLEKVSNGPREILALFRGWIYFLQGDYEAAMIHYQPLLKAGKNKRKDYLSDISGLFWVLTLIKQRTPESLQEAEGLMNLITSQSKHWLHFIYSRLKNLLQVHQGDLIGREIMITAVTNLQVFALGEETYTSLDALIGSMCLYWVDSDKAQRHLPSFLDSFYKQAVSSDYHWVAMETASLLARLMPKSSYATQAEILRDDRKIMPLVELIPSLEPWEQCLDALANLNQPPPQAAKATESEFRLIWWIQFHSGGSFSLQPREQKITSKGGWSKGRNIALKRLSKEIDKYDYLTSQDLQVCRHLKALYPDNHYYSYGGEFYQFGERSIVALIGHPLVFWEDAPTVSVEIVKGEPELLVKKLGDDRLALQFVPPLQEDKEVLILKETPTRLKVIEVTAEHRRIANILGQKNRLEVPIAAKDKVLNVIGAVSNIVTVHSDIGGGVKNAEEVPADPKPHVHLLPAGDGLKVAVLCRPFAQGGPYYRPGTGGEMVVAEVEGKLLQTARDLQEEQQLAEQVVKSCPTLVRESHHNQEWLLEKPESCLELLLELQDLGDSILLEWPEGEKLRISRRLDFDSLQMRIQRQNDWFAASGELTVRDDLVLDMQQLMALLEKSSGNFIPIGEGQFLALTEQFRKRLDELRAYGDKHGDGLRFHPLATLAMEDTLDSFGKLKADRHWQAHVKRLKEMQTLQPELPSTLQAELRDYQMEGFTWLARLSHWGVGACLADDMGLGKTLQALAVILTRAPQGPMLIIAPTSVCMNWFAEAQRFAPTLNPIEFGTKDRQQVLDQLQPCDMLICSYGLLQQEDVAEMLAQVEWQMVVLDEAQAIKNMTTKRSQAAMKLQAGFKLITTGTPIENHLGELWNLFRFINPGLLGSLERFNSNFATPIEKYQDKQARNKLKKLIQPFLLRRTKSQVLQELPSRTEILLHVDLSPQEMAFYEALRRDALAKLSESDAEAGHKHLQVLAEIMKLRRACCNPRLVMPDAAPASSKLQLFAEVLEELLENRHKALVFSQFVDHLHILREHLDQQKIHYQYLDGSTPAPERKKRVDAFQAGQGDVFLISLKAGGTGLNLTAADYVIHMDPWWNPAVEDQASDRAHRIGQQRPVTIYRLVAKGTIEEKIVQLHHHKRDLADSLLEGADISGRMSTDELISLIQDNSDR